MSYQVGDKILYQFEDGTIEEMEGERVTEAKYSCFRTNGWDLRDSIVEKNKRNDEISKEFYELNGECHNLPGNLNMPDIHRHLVWLWKQSCERTEAENFIQTAREFVDGIRSYINDAPMVQGVAIFRPTINIGKKVELDKGV